METMSVDLNLEMRNLTWKNIDSFLCWSQWVFELAPINAQSYSGFDLKEKI